MEDISCSSSDAKNLSTQGFFSWIKCDRLVGGGNGDNRGARAQRQCRRNNMQSMCLQAVQVLEACSQKPIGALVIGHVKVDHLL
jgi:hypothetical protein